MIGLISTLISVAIPLLVITIGLLICEKAGVWNFGAEGIAVSTAAIAYVVSVNTGSISLSLLTVILFSIFLGLLLGILMIHLGLDQVVVGVSIIIFGYGFGEFLSDMFAPGFLVAPEITTINLFLFEIKPFILFAFLLIPLTWFILNKTRLGLIIQSVGDYPVGSDMVGIKVNRIRIACFIFGTILIGLTGFYLVNSEYLVFNISIVGGAGFLAIALVRLANWREDLITIFALVFYSFVYISRFLRMWISIPEEVIYMSPFLLTLISYALSLKWGKKTREPLSLGKAYRKVSTS